MTEPNLAPSKLLKAGATAARWALGLVALAWLVVAIVWGGLHFLIVPRIAEMRPMLEELASKRVGANVHIGSIVATSNGLIPSFTLGDVTLQDTNGREVLRLPTVVVALSARSVLRMGVEQLYVDGPVLDVRRTADGHVWIAGIALTDTTDATSAGADWLFSQPEVAIVRGTVNWTDEQRGAAPLTLVAVDGVIRNSLLTHALRVDATPPPEWGERMRISGVLKQPLWSRRAGDWENWVGQLYADLPRVDLAQLRRYADVGVDVAQGAGSLRAWVDVDRARLKGVTADIALANVNARFDPKLDALMFSTIAGRLGTRWLDGGFEVSTEDLQFDTQDGLHWPGGNVRLARYAADKAKPERGDFVADKLDLAAMAQIASRLPLGDDAHAALDSLLLQGVVEQIEGGWTGPLHAPTHYTAKGRVARLTVPSATRNAVQTPGFKGADIDFEISPTGGRASVVMQGGSIDALGYFDEPVIAVDQLAAEVQWKLQGGNIFVTLPKLRFANADGQGELQLKWQTGDKQRFPGVLDLQGTISRVDGVRVHRYLPTELDKEVRDYLRDAIVGGSASGVKFKAKGNLNDFPFADPKTGEFRLSANFHNATYAYAPASILPKDSLPWPVLDQLSGELLIDHGTLSIKGATGSVVGAPGLQITKANGVINNLYGDAALVLNADARGPLADAMMLVNTSPLSLLTDKVLARAVVGGAADYKLKLAFPLATVERATVQGTVTLGGNDVQISPDTPRLTRTRGVVSFTESGFTVAGGQARSLGGDLRMEGGLNVLRPTTLRIQGTATAEGVRQAKELGFAARLGDYASGSAAYSAVLGLRSGVPELQINSTLVGLALSLPAPFVKTAEQPLPLHLETTAVRGTAAQDQLKLDIGKLANIVFVRDVAGEQARVLRGAIGVGLVGDESAPLPSEGVVANIQVDSVDVDAWMQVLSKTSSSAAISDMGYLPTSMAVRARELVMDGRKINNVVVGGARDGLLWRANLDASELSGYVEYRQPTGANAGRLYGRLARLAIGQSTAQDMENLLDEQPASIPALDIVVEDFELRGKRLGRVDIDAVNGNREWRLNRFNITTPEAVLTASGNWTAINAMSAIGAPRTIKDRRRTVMNFKLDIADAGDLLERFGMTGVVRKGRGKVEGQVSWLGSPITLDYPSLGGSFNVNVEVGQFLKADPGLAKLLGVLSLQSLPRRFALDFRDVFSEGFAFDFFRGDVVIEQGMARTSNLQMKGVSAAVLMDGQADIAKETQALRVVVIPEINAGSASLLASALNPIIGLTTFLAQAILRGPLNNAATQEFFVDGTWVEPRVTKVDRSTPK